MARVQLPGRTGQPIPSIQRQQIAGLVLHPGPLIPKGRFVQKGFDRTDEEIAQLILHNCQQMGETPKAADRMVKRCLENRRKSAVPVTPE